MGLQGVLFVILVLGIFYFYIQRLWKHRKSPPGPWAFPIVGHLPLLGSAPHETLAKWSKNYGNIISVRFGSFPAVVLNDASLIKEAFSQPVFSLRPKLPFFEEATEGHGFSFTSQNKLEERAVIYKYLKAAGRRWWELERKNLEELSLLIDRFLSYEGQPISMKHQFTAPVVTAISSLVLEQKMDYSDPKFDELSHGAKAFFTCDGILANFAVFIPWIGNIFRSASGIDKRVNGLHAVTKFIKNKVKEEETHIAEVPGQAATFREAFLEQVESNKYFPNSVFHSSQSASFDSLLASTVRDFFLAALDTVSITLEFFTIYMARNPSIQKKLYEEIVRVIGISRLPTLRDRKSSPYTQAVISETNRYCTIAPLSNFHRATENVVFHGYEIPKDTMVISNLYAVHYSEEVWGDPQVFRPERFIDDEGNFKKSEFVVPFGIGRRVCIGETQAMDTLFLYVTSLVQRFEICCCGGNIPDPDVNGTAGIVLDTKPFKLVLKDRLAQ